MRYTWHLAVDTQLFWLSPFFVYILWRFRKLGLILLGITISVAILLDATVQSIYNLPPSFFYLGAHEYGVLYIYLLPHTCFLIIHNYHIGRLHLSTILQLPFLDIFKLTINYPVIFRVYFLDGFFIN